MGYRFEHGEGVTDGLRRIAEEQIAKALDEISDGSLDDARTVHQVRKRCKKIRGLVRLARPALGEKRYDRENDGYRDTARLLARARDAHVLCETLDLLLDEDDEAPPPGTDALRGWLSEERESRHPDDLSARLDEVEDRLRKGRDRLGDWRLDAKGFEALGPGLAKTYGRGRRALEAARLEPSPETLHEWRKRVKYGGYHVRLLRDVWTRPMVKRREAYDDLGDLLGDDHDLAGLRRVLDAERDALPSPSLGEALGHRIDRRRRRLQEEAFALGRRVHAEKTKAYPRRIGRYWAAWQGEA